MAIMVAVFSAFGDSCMPDPDLQFVDCPDTQGGHRMACWRWGNASAPHVVLCIHGLTRQGRDFDVLAQRLVYAGDGAVRVLCPDVVGRGRSDWLSDPSGYQVPAYAADMLALLAKVHADSPMSMLDIVGTSMGGLIGIVLTGGDSQALPSPIRRLVINDVGPAIDPAGLARIAGYVGQGGPFESVDEAAVAMWRLSASFGPHTQQEWAALSEPMVVPAGWRTADGSAKSPDDRQDAGGTGPFVLHYDPAIARPFRNAAPDAASQGEAVMWALYDRIEASTLVTRGADSDLLSRDTAQAMTTRGPHARLVEFEGVGHAPTFVAAAQGAIVEAFLLD